MASLSPLIAVSEVEDSVSGLYTDILRREGYRVIAIPDKSRLFNLLSSIKPDLIITSVQSNSMDGLEFLEAVKASFRLREIPVIVASSHSELKAETLRLGAMQFLVKPFGMEELKLAVKTAVSRSPWPAMEN